MNSAEFMRHLGDIITPALRQFHGEEMGFVLTVFRFNDEQAVADFISNCDRKTSIDSLRRLADVLEERSYMPPTIGGMQ